MYDAIAELTSDHHIDHAGLDALRGHPLDAGGAGRIDLAAVDEQRVPVFAGGVAIVSALSDGALREGLQHGPLGRVHAQDIR